MSAARFRHREGLRDDVCAFSSSSHGGSSSLLRVERYRLDRETRQFRAERAARDTGRHRAQPTVSD